MAANVEPGFGDLLREFRDRAGLTQEELAERAGLSADAIGLLERGERRRPQRQTVRRLAEALALAGGERVRLEAAARRGGQPGSPVRSPTTSSVLPLPATTFVGRAAEVADLTRLLVHPATRLVTLTGPGGVGKTRLALEAAAQLTGWFADGVVFVPLAALREPAMLPDSIARACGVAERDGQTPLAAVSARLGARRLLLVLDNCEHLLSAAPLVADLLARCPRLVVLVTSRVPLHLAAERQHPVSPLPVPEAARVVDSEELARQPAMALFTQRAGAVAPGFAVTADTASAISAICRRLDGLPLAIELAAAWVKVLPPRALLARLDRALPLLTGGPRDLPERQRTLRGAITWSHDLLAPAEQALLRRLAVFAGGWTLAAAEAVCAGSPTLSSYEPVVILPGLAALVDASLVQLSAPTTDAVSDEPRYMMLETVREYATELLVASGEETVARRHHAAYVLALVEEAGRHLVGPQEGAWLARLDVEGPNLRAALAWTLDQREADMAVRFAAVLWRFWAARGHLHEGRRWLEAILALAVPGGTVAPLRRAMLLHVTANLARAQGDYAPAEAWYEECLAIRRTHDDPAGIIAALHNLGITAHEQGDHARAIRLFEAVLPLARERGEPYAIAFGLTAFGEAVQAGDPARAIALYEEGLDWFRRIGHTWGIALALTRLGDAVFEQGDRVRASALHRESLALSGELGDPRSAVDAVEGLAHAEVATNPGLAARLVGAAETLRDRLGVPRPLVRRAGHDRAMLAARTALGDTAFATAQVEGAALTLEQVLALALSDTA